MGDANHNPKIDTYLGELKNWQQELALLRSIVLEFPFEEDMKWGKPCYTFQGNNTLILYSFKDCCALGFFKGSLLADADGFLQKPGENSQAMRMAKFTDSEQIMQSLPTLKAFITAAIDAEKAGLTVVFQKSDDMPVPEEFQQKLDEIPPLQTAFHALTAGRQRAYLMHFAQPKQTATRISRIEKCIPQILRGKGLTDPD